MSERVHDCTWALERIEAFLDGDLDAPAQEALAAHTDACRACAVELAFAARVRNALRELPREEAPARTIEAAQRAALGTGAATGGNVIPLPRARRARLRWIPAAAAAVLVLVVSGVWYDAHRRAPADDAALAGVSEAEVAAARAGVEMAFAYVGHYSGRAVRIVEDDVLGERVAPRVERAIDQSRRDVIDDALMPGLRRAATESGLGVTSAPPGRS